jgi:hypothetical protein
MVSDNLTLTFEAPSTEHAVIFLKSMQISAGHHGICQDDWGLDIRCLKMPNKEAEL